MKLRTASLSLLAFCLVALPAAAQTLYSNGPIDGQDTAWTINFGFAVSDSFTLANASTVNGLSFGGWMFPGDSFVGVEVLITSSEFGGTTYTDQFINLTQSGCFLNQAGFNVCTESGSFGTIGSGAGLARSRLRTMTQRQYSSTVSPSWLVPTERT